MNSAEERASAYALRLAVVGVVKGRAQAARRQSHLCGWRGAGLISESDRMGLIFMAMAGYNPAVAVNFWQKMSAGKSGSTPEFMSTHPTDANRITKMREVLPEALQYYKK